MIKIEGTIEEIKDKNNPVVVKIKDKNNNITEINLTPAEYRRYNNIYNMSLGKKIIASIQDFEPYKVSEIKIQ